MEGVTPEEEDVLLEAENAALRVHVHVLKSLFAGVLLCPAFTKSAYQPGVPLLKQTADRDLRRRKEEIEETRATSSVSESVSD